MLHRLSTILLTLISVAAFATVEGRSQERKAGDLKIEPYVFEARGEKVEAELGRLLVPENRRNPNSNLIELAFVRFKSTNPKPGPPSVYLALTKYPI